MTCEGHEETEGVPAYDTLGSCGIDPSEMTRKSRNRRRRSKRRNRNSQGQMVRNAIEYGWDGATALLDRKPRKAAIGNVLVLSVMGVVMGLTLYWVTSNYTRNLDKAWIYAINTVIAMIIKVAFQWLMVLIAQPRVVYPVAKRIIPRRYWHLLSMMEGRSHETTVPTNMTVTAVATMILATELSRENVLPILFVDSSHAVWVVTLMGGVTAALEGLSVPQTIFALWHNRHPHHSSPTYQRHIKQRKRGR